MEKERKQEKVEGIITQRMGQGHADWFSHRPLLWGAVWVMIDFKKNI